jgi:hypothetical protein
MLNLVSLAIGLISLPMVLLAVLPFLGWANWLILPLPLIGLAVGAMSSRSAGQNLNLVVLAICIARLALSPII